MKNLLIIITTILFLHTDSLKAMDNDDPLLYRVAFEKFEYQFSKEQQLAWDGEVSLGYSLNKIILYSEGEDGEYSRAESENQLVFSHAISPFLDIQLGLAYDTTESSHYSWGVLGISGMTPYFFEVQASILFGRDSNLGFRVDADYELLLTQKLILTTNLACLVRKRK